MYKMLIAFIINVNHALRVVKTVKRMLGKLLSNLKVVVMERLSNYAGNALRNYRVSFNSQSDQKSHQMEGEKIMKPVKVEKIDLLFGGDISKLLPPMERIPKEFVSHNHHKRNKWVKMVNDWFFRGLKNVEWKPKEGIDVREATRHISAVMHSLELSHEHKEAGCAYLLSEFFEDVKYELAK